MWSQVGLRKHHYEQTSGGDGIPVELFQIPKDEACESAAINVSANLENSAVAWKRSVFIPIPKKGNAKEWSNYHTIELISYTSKVMLKILQGRIQQYMNFRLPHVQAGFRKARGTRDQIANIWWIIEKAREFQKKTFISALLTMPKPLTVWITINCGKFWKRWEYQTTWPASWETYMHIRKQHLELNMEPQTGFK